MELKTPYSDIMPAPSRDELAALRTRVEQEGGVHDAVLLSETGDVLDGHTRLAIDPDAPRKVIPGSGSWSDAQKRAFVVRCNLGRRNLSHEQRAEVLRQQRAIAVQLKAEGKTLREIADAFGVDESTACRWCGGSNLHTQDISATDCRVRVDPTKRPLIAERVNAGESVESVASQLKVTPRRVRQIVAAETRVAGERERRRAAADLSGGTLGIHAGDFRTAGVVVPDASVDLIFTDPPYLTNDIEAGIYADLGEFAARVLKPGGWCLSYAGLYALLAVGDQLRRHLEYRWTFAVRHSGGWDRIRVYRIYTAWKPVLGFVKPPLPTAWWDWFPDMASGGREKADHPWQQAAGEAEHFVGALCPENGLVCDPFCGSGTTGVAALRLGRRFVGFEIDAAVADVARGRLAGTLTEGNES